MNKDYPSKKRFSREKLALTCGALTLILFAGKPYILDLIEPAKSLGQIIGENARDLAEILNDGSVTASNSRRDIWSNIFTISSFILFALTMMLSIDLLGSKSKWFGIGAMFLAIIGLIAFFTYLAISLVAFLFIAVLVSLFVLGGGT